MKIQLTAVLLCVACGGAEGFELGGAEPLKNGGGSSKKSPPAAAAPTYALRTTDAHPAGSDPLWQSSFAMSTLAISFATEVSGPLSGHHQQTVFVFAPGGSAYARYDVAFATDVAAGASEQQAEPTATGWRVWVTMPVAGTMITQYAMSGQWSASAYVDAASAPTASASFSVQ